MEKTVKAPGNLFSQLVKFYYSNFLSGEITNYCVTFFKMNILSPPILLVFI